MSIEQIEAFYIEIRSEAEQQLARERNRIFRLGTIRLIIFLAGAASCYLFWGNSLVIFGCIAAFTLFFLFLLKLYNKAQKQRDYYEQAVKNADNEIKAIQYDFSPFGAGNEFIDPEHKFSYDLDLFGKNSFYQSINRTVSLEGKKKLADILCNPLNKKEAISVRQGQIKKLSQNPRFLLNFLNHGNTRDTEQVDIKELSKQFVKSSLSHPLYKSIWRFGIYLMPVVASASIVAYALDYISFLNFASLWFLFILISALPLKWLKKSVGVWDASVKTLESYSKLLKIVEDYDDNSLSLTIKGQKNGQASLLIARLGKHIENFNQTFTFPGILLLNPLLMWNVSYALKIEAWALKYGKNINKWVDELAEFDALVSLSLYAYNHSSYIYPQVSDNKEFVGKKLGHPLLHRDKCVANDVPMSKHPYFLVVTGANMAGKSTYLRTVGINLMLASIGAPVFAQSLSFYPFKLLTNLRTSDSLIENESYFFAELKRLKLIIDELESGEELFIILDEILKGTNSQDKQKGSIALMKQLIAERGMGIIATHDLVLGELEKEFPDEAKSYRFEADIKDDKLSFSYTIREGVAQNMNACFLMKQMGITGL